MFFHFLDRGAARFVGLRPGACGLSLRGDDSLATATIWSSSDFGTAIRRRITSLKCANSGVESNEAGFIRPHSTPTCICLEAVLLIWRFWTEYNGDLRFLEIAINHSLANRDTDTLEGLNDCVSLWVYDGRPQPIFGIVRVWDCACSIGQYDHAKLRFSQKASLNSAPAHFPFRLLEQLNKLTRGSANILRC